jgi:hypothetical protein
VIVLRHDPEVISDGPVIPPVATAAWANGAFKLSP